MVFSGLPLEIQSRILELCSPNDLAVLSRVHTLGRDLAEYALYSHIQYRVRPSDLIKPSRDVENDQSPQELKEDRSLLHTFANNSRKASMVKVFYVGLDDEYGADDEVEHEDEFDELGHDDETIGFIEFHGFHDHCARIKSIDFILVKVAEALVQMSNLADLRILHSRMDDLDAPEGILKISGAIRYVFRSGNDSD